jgi:hypothetical protein
MGDTIAPSSRLHFLSYFRRPIPSSEGFAAYRTPGAAVHLPIIIAFTAMAFLLCGPHPALQPLIALWFIAGVYFGRDIAILCHYMPLLTLICWAVTAAVIIWPKPIRNFGAAHPLFSLALSLGVLAFLLYTAFLFARNEREAQAVADELNSGSKTNGEDAS